MERKPRISSLTPWGSPCQLHHCHNWPSHVPPLSSCTMPRSCLAWTLQGHQPFFALSKLGSQAEGQGRGHLGRWLWRRSIQVPLKSAFVDPEAWLQSQRLPTADLPLQGPLPTHAAHLPWLHPVPISLSPWFWRSSMALLPCHGDATSHPGHAQPSSFTI